MKVSELQGAALDWAVARALNLNEEDYVEIDNLYGPVWRGPEYSTDWAVAGPIIEREKIGVWWATHYVDDEGQEYGNHWYAEMGCTDENADSRYCGVEDGPTPLVAAMRCYVASKLGDEVEVPEELK